MALIVLRNFQIGLGRFVCLTFIYSFQACTIQVNQHIQLLNNDFLFVQLIKRNVTIAESHDILSVKVLNHPGYLNVEGLS